MAVNDAKFWTKNRRNVNMVLDNLVTLHFLEQFSVLVFTN